ncbi:MAG: 4Fe-4S binding protein [Chloroflexi bacterium]|nr:4Fe-4S binding protein [Chloroflexota bacterium]
MSRPIWLVKLIEIGFPQRFLFARLTRVKILGRVLDRWLFEGDDIMYLPRDRVVSVDINLDTSDQLVLPSQVVHHFIETAGYHWIMNFCICRESSKCKDYPQNMGCLFLGKAVLGINPKLGRIVTREEAHEHVRKCREAGLFHLVGRNKLDTVWLGIKQGDQLLTICNCCLWRFIPDIAPHIARKVTKMPGVQVEVTDACIGCGTCVSACFINNIKQINGHSVIGDGCLGCGNCVEACPNHAIKLIANDRQYVGNSIERLARVINVA